MPSSLFVAAFTPMPDLRSIPPSEIVTHKLRGGQLAHAAVERGVVAEQQRELGAGLTGENRRVLPHLATKRLFVAVHEERYFIALRVAVDRAEAAIHQVGGGGDHVVAEAQVERRLKR